MRYSFSVVPCVLIVALIAGCGGSSGSGGVTLMKLENFQSASVVIGQANFSGDGSNQGGSMGANTLYSPYGNAGFDDGILYVSDYDNNRVLGYHGIPQANNMPADFVVGQVDFTSDVSGEASDEMDGPHSAVAAAGKLLISDNMNHRILIFDPAPESGPGNATVVVGQSGFDLFGSGCSATEIYSPENHFVAAGRLIVADSNNHRVLIWNTIPETNGEPADIVLGQDSFDTCSANDNNQDGAADGGPTGRTLDEPTGVWSDGNRLVVLDTNNHRALIWNTFPQSNFEPADVVLGQADFTSATAPATSDSTFNSPYIGVASNGRQLAIADSGNNRVLVWETFPTANLAPAGVVLGQENFTNNTENDDNQDGGDDGQPSARTLHYPAGVHITRDGTLIVSDESNNRVLVYTQ